MRKNYKARIAKYNIRYYYFIAFMVIGYILSILVMYVYPAAISSLGGILLLGVIALGISIYIFNFTGLKKLLDEEIEQDIEKYEEKIRKKEEKNI